MNQHTTHLHILHRMMIPVSITRGVVAIDSQIGFGILGKRPVVSLISFKTISVIILASPSREEDRQHFAIRTETMVVVEAAARTVLPMRTTIHSICYCLGPKLSYRDLSIHPT